jgi:glycosyltransferase involved in cell wall biosynthesis
MNSCERISVIIPNYNYARFLDQAISSALNQTYPDIEVIVVNNGSTDESLVVLKKYEEKIILINQPNLGQSGARNSGLKSISGKYVAFLDADDYWEPDKLEKQHALINEDRQLVYSGIRQFRDSDPQNSKVVSPKFRGSCSELFLDIPGASIVLSGESTALFSVSLLKKVGDFDCKLNSSAGWDFFRRCSKHTRFDFVDEPLTNYRLHDSNMSNSFRNTIPDIERAYAKFMDDREWNISTKKKLNILKSLEFNFLKTYVKSQEIKLAALSIKKYLRLLSKSWKFPQ